VSQRVYLKVVNESDHGALYSAGAVPLRLSRKPRCHRAPESHGPNSPCDHVARCHGLPYKYRRSRASEGDVLEQDVESGPESAVPVSSSIVMYRTVAFEDTVALLEYSIN
jgi:hypothetical protein